MKDQRIDTFVHRLNIAMEQRRMKQVDLVEKTGMNKSRINQYVRGKSLANQDGVYLLAKALDVSEGWLMGFDVPMERTEQAERKKVALTKEEIELLTLYNHLDFSDQMKIQGRIEEMLTQEKYKKIKLQQDA